MSRRRYFMLVGTVLMALCFASPLAAAAPELHRMGPSTIIIKKGAHGCLMSRAGEVFLLPAYPLESAVDPTGAGDSFAGAFCGQVAHSGASPEIFRRALAYATVTASFCVEDFSVDRYRALEKEDINSRYAELVRMTAIE